MRIVIPNSYVGSASLPRSFRKHIVEDYPKWVIEDIDRAGKIHDWLTDEYPKQTTKNRKTFIKLLKKYQIPKKLTRKIHFGLWVYDHMPNFIKSKLKRTT